MSREIRTLSGYGFGYAIANHQGGHSLASYKPEDPRPTTSCAGYKKDPFTVTATLTGTSYVIDVGLNRDLNPDETARLERAVDVQKNGRSVIGVVVNANGVSLEENLLSKLSNLHSSVVFYNTTQSRGRLDTAADRASAINHVREELVDIFHGGGEKLYASTNHTSSNRSIVTVRLRSDLKIDDSNVSKVTEDLGSINKYHNSEPLLINFELPNVVCENEDFYGRLNNLLIRLNEVNGYLVITSKNKKLEGKLKGKGYVVFNESRDARNFLRNVRDLETIPPPPNDHFTGLRKITNLGNSTFTMKLAPKEMTDFSTMIECEQIRNRKITAIIKLEDSEFIPDGDFIRAAKKLTLGHANVLFIANEPLQSTLGFHGLPVYSNDASAAKATRFTRRESFMPPMVIDRLEGSDRAIVDVRLNNIAGMNALSIIEDGLNLRGELKRADNAIPLFYLPPEEPLSENHLHFLNAFGDMGYVICSETTRRALQKGGVNLPVFKDTKTALIGIREREYLYSRGLSTFSLSQHRDLPDKILVTFPDGEEGRNLLQKGERLEQLESDLCYLFNDFPDYNLVFIFPPSVDSLNSQFIEVMKSYSSDFKHNLIVVRSPKLMKQFPPNVGGEEGFSSVDSLIRNKGFSKYRTLRPRYLVDPKTVYVNFTDKEWTKLSDELSTLPQANYVFDFETVTNRPLLRDFTRNLLEAYLANFKSAMETRGNRVCVILPINSPLRKHARQAGFIVVEDKEMAAEVLSRSFHPDIKKWTQITPPEYRRGEYYRTGPRFALDDLNAKTLVSELKTAVNDGAKIVVEFPSDYRFAIALAVELQAFQKNNPKESSHVAFIVYDKNLELVLIESPWNLQSTHSTEEEAAKALFPKEELKETPQPTKIIIPERPRPFRELTVSSSMDKFGTDSVDFSPSYKTTAVGESDFFVVTLKNGSAKADRASVEGLCTSISEKIFFANTRNVVIDLNGQDLSPTTIDMLIKDQKQRGKRVSFCNGSHTVTTIAGFYGLTIHPSEADALQELANLHPHRIFSDRLSPDLHADISCPAYGKNFVTLSMENPDLAKLQAAIETIDLDNYPYPYLYVDLRNVQTIDSDLIHAIKTLDALTGRFNITLGILHSNVRTLVQNLRSSNIPISADEEILIRSSFTSEEKYLSPPKGGFTFFTRPKHVKVELHPNNVFHVKLQRDTLEEEDLDDLRSDLASFQGNSLILDIREAHAVQKILCVDPKKQSSSRKSFLDTLELFCKGDSRIVLVAGQLKELDLWSYPSLNKALTIYEAELLRGKQPVLFKLMGSPSSEELFVRNSNEESPLFDSLNNDDVHIELQLLRDRYGKHPKTKHITYEINSTDDDPNIANGIFLLHKIFGAKLCLCAPEEKTRKQLRLGTLDKLLGLEIFKSRSETMTYHAKGLKLIDHATDYLNIHPEGDYNTVVFSDVPSMSGGEDPSQAVPDFYQNVTSVLAEYAREKNLVYNISPYTTIPLNKEFLKGLDEIENSLFRNNKKAVFACATKDPFKYKAVEEQLKLYGIRLAPSIEAATYELAA